MKTSWVLEMMTSWEPQSLLGLEMMTSWGLQSLLELEMRPSLGLQSLVKQLELEQRLQVLGLLLLQGQDCSQEKKERTP